MTEARSPVSRHGSCAPTFWVRHTYLVADTVDSGRRCVEEVTFRVVPIEGIEYSVNLVSDLRGTVSWNVRYGEGRSVRLSRCTPRRTGDPKECLKGGIPKPLFGTLQGMITAKPAGRDSDSRRTRPTVDALQAQKRYLFWGGFRVSSLPWVHWPEILMQSTCREVRRS